MNEVKRYDCTNGRAQHCYGCYQMTETSEGEYVSSSDFDQVTAEREALQLLLNDRDEQLHNLEQSRRAEFDNGQAAERRVENIDGLLLAWYEANAKGLVQVDDSAYHIVTATAEALQGKPSGVDRAVLLTMDREMRVYIAGPMTGLPEFNFPAFNAMADKLRAAGWHVENPADHGHVEGAGWADYLRYDIGRLATCEVVMLLPGWTQSRGARLEVSIARALGIGLMYADGAEYKPATEACEFPQSCTTRCDFDIPDFSPGNGNKARRRAAAIEALKPENQRVVPVLPGDPLSTCLGCFGTGTISTGIEEASSTICNGCNGTGREQA